MKLRPYQQEAVDQAMKQWESGKQRVLLNLATGAGKTVIFSAIIKQLLEENRDNRILVLAHRSELLEQARDKIEAITHEKTALEKAASWSLLNPHSVTIGSVQTFNSGVRLYYFDQNYFDYIILDECHHLSDGALNVLNYFPEAKILGVTATPERSDMRNISDYFEIEAFRYSMADATKDGYLCPIRVKNIPLKIDIQNVSITKGDFATGEIAHAVEPYLDAIADKIVAVCRNRKTVIFLPVIKTSQKMTEILSERGFRVAEVHGTSKDRKQILEDFALGKYDILCNSLLLTEGWDCPSVNTIICLRPTKSKGIYRQIVGRGTRLYPGKTETLLLDFFWLTQQHDICRPSCLVASDEYEAMKMDQIIMKNHEMDLLVAQELAKAEIFSEEKKSILGRLDKKTKYISPGELAVLLNCPDIATYEPMYGWEKEEPSESQLETLYGKNIDIQLVHSKGLATLIIGILFDRQSKNLCTPKQIRMLQRYKIKHLELWSFDMARNALSILSSNGWKPSKMLWEMVKKVQLK